MPKTKKEWKIAIFKVLIVIFGTFLVAFGNIAFLVPLDINAGGLNGVAIIARYFVAENTKVLLYNIIVDASAVLLWVIGLIFIGKEFALKTLVATIAFPLANWLFTACPGLSDVLIKFGEILKDAGNGPTAGNYLMSGIFGGVFVGVGVAVTFVGGGSTGGVDVLTFLIEKYLHIRQSIASFLIDGTIITVGLCILLPMQSDFLLPCLSGIISAFMSAIIIEVIFIGSQTSYQVDIISEKWEEISQYAQNELGRGTTIIHAQGGYHGDERVILRIVFNKREYAKIRSYIAKIDPTAFVTYTQTNAVFGEGFKSHTNTNLFTETKKKGKKDGK
ncbi:MAG: YitT family protein [Bacilli bacterium]|nr:YitT family protein [Bacilli bacterium]